jgi:competence ComEA-like helix-hairpin-helix protein
VRGIFTREERMVVFFLAACLLVGAMVTAAGRVFPSTVPGFPFVPSEPVAGDDEHETASGPVDINAATEEELVRLPGVGPVRAAAIVRLREERGGFGSVDDLLEIRGIGPVTLEKLRSAATVGRHEVGVPDTGLSAAGDAEGGSRSPDPESPVPESPGMGG